MRNIFLIVSVLSFGLAGCADKSANVPGTSVSPIPYEGYSCGQLAEERSRVSARAAQISKDQKKFAQSFAPGHDVIIFMDVPLAFGSLALLKGEKDAIEQASIKRNCGVQFQQG